MKTIVAALFAAFATAGAVMPAAAQTYASIGYTDLDQANLGAITGRVGWLAPHPTISLGVEGEASFGVKDANVSGITGKLSSEFAGYGLASLNTLGKFQPFVRIGYGTSRLKASSAGASGSVSEDSFNYGAGAFFNITPHDSIRIDYTRFDFQNVGYSDTYGISYARKF